VREKLFCSDINLIIIQTIQNLHVKCISSPNRIKMIIWSARDDVYLVYVHN
jgi:hypothetical protein